MPMGSVGEERSLRGFLIRNDLTRCPSHSSGKSPSVLKSRKQPSNLRRYFSLSFARRSTCPGCASIPSVERKARAFAFVVSNMAQRLPPGSPSFPFPPYFAIRVSQTKSVSNSEFQRACSTCPPSLQFNFGFPVRLVTQPRAMNTTSKTKDAASCRKARRGAASPKANDTRRRSATT